MQIRSRNILSWFFVLAIGGLCTWQFHRAQFSSNFDSFFGNRGDARYITYLMEHWYQAILGKTNLLSPAMFYPVKGVLGYSDVLLGYAIPFSILRAIGLDTLTALEFTIIFLNFVNYIVCFILLCAVLRFNVIASCAGAAFFAFNSPKFAQMFHLQLQAVFFLPLITIFIILFVRNAATISQKKAFGLLSVAGLFLNLQLLTAFYWGWFFVFWCFLFTALGFSLRRTRLFILTLVKNFWKALIGSAAVFIIGFVPFLLIYLSIIRTVNWWPYDHVNDMIPGVRSFLSMNDGNYVWGYLAVALRQTPALPNWEEHHIGIGLIASLTWLAASILGIWILTKYAKSSSTSISNTIAADDRRELNFLFLALTILATTFFYVIGVKYWADYSPWRYVYLYFPGAKAIRAVARYVIVLSLPMAVVFAFTIHWGMQKISLQRGALTRRVLTILLFIVVASGLFEQFGDSSGINTGFSKRNEKAFLEKLAAKLPDDCSAFYVAAEPEDDGDSYEYQIDAMLISVMRQVPTVNGINGQFPPNWDFYEIKAPDYEEKVWRWINRHAIKGNICRLEIKAASEAENPIDAR